MIVIIEHGKGPAYPSVWLAKSRHSKAEYNAKGRPYFAMYHTGELPPNYPLPVPMAVAEYDLEYIYLYNQWAELTLENRKLKGSLVS